MNFSSSEIAWTYLILAIATNVTIYELVKRGLCQTRNRRFFAILAICVTSTLTMVGPLGLILGGPSILLSATLASRLLDK